MNFRIDINGLRAIAVLGVVFFHFLGNFLPGGFAGVDVFFVISGFLMTSIIVRGMQKDSFKISGFYKARAKRIVPALSVLCLTLVVLGWFFLHPIDFGTLGKHILGSLSFTSNFIYWKESGYFDEASREKWLLHTWSLSVEWQFYICYPIFLVLLNKVLRPYRQRYVLLASAVLSFSICLYVSGHWPSSAFYLLPARAWEMLAGGLAFLYPLTLSKSAKRLIELLGLLLVLVAYVLLSEASVWPGYLAMIPVAGAVLIVVANRDDSWLTGNAVFQWIGSASYSIYLWHWPLVVWLNYSGKSAAPSFVGIAILLSIGFGALSYYVVENRKKTTCAGKYLMILAGPNLGWLFAISFAASLVVFFNDGFDSRLNAEYKAITKNHVMPQRGNGYCFVDFNNGSKPVDTEKGLHCLLGDRSKPVRALLFGDSFAGHYEPFWDVIGKANGVAINVVTTNWCMPISGEAFDGPITSPAFQQCQVNRKYLLRNMDQYEVIIFAGMWSNSLKGEYLNQVMDTIHQASERVRTVIVMPPPTRYDTNVLKRFHRSLFYKTPFDLQRYSTKNDEETRRAYGLLRQDAKKLENVIFVERNQLFSASGLYEKSGYLIPYSFDGMHITLEGAIESARMFQESEQYKEQLLSRLSH